MEGRKRKKREEQKIIQKYPQQNVDAIRIITLGQYGTERGGIPSRHPPEQKEQEQEEPTMGAAKKKDPQNNTIQA